MVALKAGRMVVQMAVGMAVEMVRHWDVTKGGSKDFEQVAE